jgi:transcriptional regulator with XRE-family HTH domain
MDIYTQLGKRIIYLRKKRKMSQLQLAIESEINKNYISDLERGKRNPSLMILNRIAIALKIDMSELLKGIQDFSLEDIVLTISSIK